MKFLNWGKIKSFFRARRENIGPAEKVGVFESKSMSFTLPDRRTIHVKPERIWERRRNAKWRLPAHTKVGDFVIFPFGIARHTVRSGIVKEIRGSQAKILMTCKSGICNSGKCITYRKVETGTTDAVSYRHRIA